jgi:tRNA/rRNA methyltransferase
MTPASFTRPRNGRARSAGSAPSMVQNLRSALGRASFTDQEVRTFRGVVTALSRGRGRVLAKLAEKKPKGGV